MFFPNSQVSALPHRSDPTNKGQRALILVVERNLTLQRLEKFFLEQAGYAVEFVSDGVSAPERARRLRSHILLRFTNDREMERTIRVIKTRGGAHDNREHHLRITREASK